MTRDNTKKVGAIKSIFAYYDDKNGIMNCDFGTITYYHEYRHKLQMDNKILYNIWNWMPSFTGTLGLYSTSLWVIDKRPEWLMLGGLFIMPISVFLLGLEIDAWIYAIKQKLKFRKNGFFKVRGNKE